MILVPDNAVLFLFYTYKILHLKFKRPASWPTAITLFFLFTQLPACSASHSSMILTASESNIRSEAL